VRMPGLLFCDGLAFTVRGLCIGPISSCCLTFIDSMRLETFVHFCSNKALYYNV
jgi:hypothetical protein